MSTDRELLELDFLRQVLDYCPSSGVFHWKKSLSNAAPAGSEAGRSRNSDGYKQVCINKKFYKCHRLAWFFVNGVWPDQIDHINGDRVDNRIENLRDVSGQTNSENQGFAHSNNKSGYLGVSSRGNGRYQADIRIEGKKKFIGSFSCPEEAHKAYLKEKIKYHRGAARAAEIGRRMP